MVRINVEYWAWINPKTNELILRTSKTKGFVRVNIIEYDRNITKDK